MARKSKALSNMIEMLKDEEKIEEAELENYDFNKDFIITFQSNMEILSDKRNGEFVDHNLGSILLTVIFAIMANCNTFVEIYLFMHKHSEWLFDHIIFDNGLPSLSTIKRVIGIINPKELEMLCNEVLKDFLKTNEKYYQDEDITIRDANPMDGKTANSSGREDSVNGKVKKTNAMSITSVIKDHCLATEFIDKKTNEIPTGIDLLKRINIRDCIILFDAMSTQTETIKYIVKKHSYYVAPVKGNQPTLENEIELFFSKKENFKNNSYTHIIKEKAHGTEKREYVFTNDVNWISTKNDWKGLTSIGFVARTYYDKKGNERKETRYYISNISASKIELLSKAIRDEWKVENKLHLYLDMAFKEDENKCFLENSQKNLNIIRKFCLAILKGYKKQVNLSMSNIRFNISMDFENEMDSIIKKTFYN